MSIDTAIKRRSAGGVPFIPLGPGVTPDATKGASWRAQAGWSYGRGVAELTHGADDEIDYYQERRVRRLARIKQEDEIILRVIIKMITGGMMR